MAIQRVTAIVCDSRIMYWSQVTKATRKNVFINSSAVLFLVNNMKNNHMALSMWYNQNRRLNQEKHNGITDSWILCVFNPFILLFSDLYHHYYTFFSRQLKHNKQLWVGKCTNVPAGCSQGREMSHLWGWEQNDAAKSHKYDKSCTHDHEGSLKPHWQVHNMPYFVSSI